MAPTEEGLTDLEESVSKMVKKAVERAMDTMRRSLAEWVKESQTKAAKKMGLQLSHLPNGDKGEESTHSKETYSDVLKLLPEMPALQVFDENSKRVFVQKAPTSISQGTNPILCSPNPYRNALKTHCNRVMVYKLHENEYGKFDSKFENVNSLMFLFESMLLIDITTGGLYGITAISQAAFVAPVDATKCGNADTLPTCTNIKDANCCPPPNPNIIDFTFPTNQPMRIRPAAQLADHKYVEKYNKAMKIMRSLPKEHPHSFAQQAAIHCAYCDSAYEMVGFPNVKMDVHFSWLFFPFHRWYLYFYEKILGKLIGDPTFAIPYWNWDSRDGMPIPDMFANSSSPLYDKLRDDNHQPPLKIDLNYSKSNPSPVGDELIEANYSVMYTQMVSSSKTSELFFGGAYRGGEDQVKAAGALENQPHTQLHIWTGDPEQKYGEDMGRFFSAGRDPLFYSHHANVDRMWNIWKTLPGKNRKDIEDPDWLDSAFLFYDENEKLVRVKVRDCVDTKKMGYVYQDVPLPWLRARSPPKNKGKGNKAGVANAAETPQVFPKDSQVFPKVLDGLLKVTIPRPKKSRTKQEKEDEEEILVIDGIEYDGDEYIKFDVFLNDEDEVESGPNNAEFAGSYSNVPSKSNNRVKVSMSLGITELLEDVGADDDDNVVVALVPRTGKGKVTIGGAKIIISS